MEKTAVLLSIRPEYADKIFDGSKKVELRRRLPRICAGDMVVVYVSSPSKALVGTFTVDEIISDSPESLWRRVANDAGIEKAAYHEYFRGTDIAYGIRIRDVWPLRAPVPLARLRRKMSGFHPPQSYRYLCQDSVKSLCGR